MIQFTDSYKPALLRPLQKGMALGLLLLGFTLPTQAQHISGEVYGGGKEGKVSESTSVTVSEGEVGLDKWIDTPTGGVFGGGEGVAAVVSGSTNVKIEDGIIRNCVYGGGKKANTDGNTNVEITGGTIRENVYAGARMADVTGYTYVFVHDTLTTSVSPVLGAVYGGNDIAGEIKNTGNASPTFYASVGAANKPSSSVPSTYVRIRMNDVAKQPYIGAVYGGSDGGYIYVPNGTKFDITLPKDKFDQNQGTEVVTVDKKPAVDRSYVFYEGGTVGNIYAGGDNVTVSQEADIYMGANPAIAPATIPLSYVKGDDAFITEFDAEPDSYDEGGSSGSETATFKYQVNRVFGGNNKAAMNIRPDWHLLGAKVNNLYSGGNRGDMTYANGICVTVENDNMEVNNVFGGCRLSDVHPTAGSITAETIDGFNFPEGYSARVLIKGGKINTVYGGNDVSGQVYHGANVVIRSNIIGNVYGSGNGSYAYYSNDTYKDKSDYYFQTNGLTGVSAIEALNTHRPNTENVLVDIAGTDATHKTYIGGNVFCGGNSATLRDLTGNLASARAKLKLGSYATINGVFLGSNGDQMLEENIIIGMNDETYNTAIDLTDKDQMAEYMRGVDVAIKPTVEFDKNYTDYSTSIGSFFCGGNKGSMSAEGTFNIDFLKKVRIFDKLVAGSNDANVQEKTDGTNVNANHAYALGGLTSEAHPKVLLNVAGLVMEPKKITYDATTGTYGEAWNYYKGTDDEGDMKAYKGFLHGANIYGGCYNSGYVNGDVEINISESVISAETDAEINTDPTTHTVRRHAHDWEMTMYEPLLSVLSCYGGGYGTETEIWGNTNVSVTGKGRIMKVHGGGELGWVGKMKRDSDHGTILLDDTVNNSYKSYYYNDSTKFVRIKKYKVDKAYDATARLNADLIKDSNNKIMNNVGELFAGGLAGNVTGDTHAIVDNGCAYVAFGGAANAHVYGAAETFIGKDGFPYITQTVYGANDFGGVVMGAKVHETKNQNTGSIQKVKSNTYVEYIQGEIGYATGEMGNVDTTSVDFGIFGASYGFYNYRSADSKYRGKAVAQPNQMTPVTLSSPSEADFASNTFVNISSKSTNAADKVGRIYGGGQGYPGQMGLACTRQTYVLLNAANYTARPSFLAQYVFGAGDCSTTTYSRLDAYAGNARHLFGACRGVGYYQKVDDLDGSANDQVEAGQDVNLSYMGEYSQLNVYPGMVAPAMEVFASGAFSGTKHTSLNLYGGTLYNVYGASVEEGITYLSEVNVPKGSTLKCNAIFGGGKGLYKERPCDCFITSVNYHSEDATVEEAIYGGNCDYRFTRRTTIDIDVPVKNSLGKLVDVYGGGKGKNTISEITFVNLDKGAKVKNVFGGGCDGLVYSKPAVIHYMLTQDYFKDKYAGTADTCYYLGDCETKGFNKWKQLPHIKDMSLYAKSTTPMTIGTLVDVKMTYAEEAYDRNTEILIHEGALVEEDAYGGGKGTDATTVGTTLVQLLGGTVQGDIYGGGYGGDIKDTVTVSNDASVAKAPIQGYTLPNGTNINLKLDSKIHLYGGTCTNSYGSGYEGNVQGNTYTYVGRDSCGTDPVRTYLDGDPAITRSIYGGGEKGSVGGTAEVNIDYGHIGYKYDTSTKKYLENVDYKNSADSILYENGNVFGGGYGEGAYTMKTIVNMRDGIIRNSLYGGGEIAAIGRGTVNTDTDLPVPPLKSITAPGETHIYMYGGHVLRNVFGGGRGYSYDIRGNEVVGDRFYTDGYVFGTTDVNIYRGEIGTGDERALALGYGNVFGGGNVGFVYSGEGTKFTGESTATKTNGYYYKGDTNVLTEDCRVVISPYCKVTAADGVDVGGKHYDACDYVPTDKLNTLRGKVLEGTTVTDPDAATWDKLDYTTGVTVHNAVFAGGNVTRGDSKLYADTRTVYGNVTATLNDIYHRDLITIGTEHTGGIYGEGNLTRVDGYREICIANYGTDYYGLKEEITKAEYDQLTDRERAYFQLMYKCKTAYDKYVVNTTIKEDAYKLLPDAEKTNWELAGFCTVYAGRLLNTIQCADFVGVHGSRMVLQGAQDRTVSEADYTDYAINRVKEVSLNQRATSVTSGENANEQSHGNYFGMYSVVNHLAALTSDVNLQSTRKTDSATRPFEEDYPTYYAYKEHYKDQPQRNNGASENVIALASGIYLELTTEESTPENKVYGPITGVIQLELINIGDNMGGAFVYAKNVHGTRSGDMATQAILSPYNTGARTNRGYTYDTTANAIETSGNFVHSTKQIIDDCYPTASDLTAPAHYWFLRGSVYVYDQHISAYTGSSAAYKADATIPLTITAGSHGRLKVIAVQPNLYAYYKDATTKMGENDEVVINGVTYKLNDVVSYWDWSNMNSDQQKLFVHDTYICTQDFSYTDTGTGSTVNVTKGSVMLSTEYDALPDDVTVSGSTVDKSEAVHVSNGTKHSTGYALTADISNPGEWNDRYIKIDPNDTAIKDSALILTKKQYDAITNAEIKAKYVAGPTYSATAGIYGQTEYKVNDIISDEIKGAYELIPAEQRSALPGQATIQKAYVTKEAVTYTSGGTEHSLQKGVGISKAEYDAITDANIQAKFDEAYVCLETLNIGEEFIVTGELISKTRYDNLTTEQKGKFSGAHICTTAGSYGGTIYDASKNYDALKAFCELEGNERNNFKFNYDAFDLFINDLNPNATITQYDGNGTAGTADYYSRSLPIEYTAIAVTGFDYKDKAGTTVNITSGQQLSNHDFETTIPNEMIHYSSIEFKEGKTTAYVVNSEFVTGTTSYSVGKQLTEAEYSNLDASLQSKVTAITKASLAGNTDNSTYYYCREAYEVNEAGSGVDVTDAQDSNKTYGTATTATATTVPLGTVITMANYQQLPNYQKNFRITGISPEETSTLYVARDASMNDVLKERIITLIYKYEYEESNTAGTQVDLVSERHVVNIHLDFRSGSPSVGRLQVPGAVIPGTTVGMKQPSITKGAYEVLGGGWEVYENESDAVNHQNGQPFGSNNTEIYFYQTGRYVTYYAKTYLGKTYSNAVPLTVANYHSINDVMADTEHHMYIDHPNVPRNCKIYIDNDVSKSDPTKNELDLLKDLYDTSLTSLNEHVKGCKNLDFILQEDVSPKKYTNWTPLGSSTQCFGEGGYFHGDGHAITGLNNPLFDYYCGAIFNTGVKGTFSGPGIANHGAYAANCWTWSETPAGHTGKPIFGDDTPNIYNCYYCEADDATNKYTPAGAIRKTEEAFGNGEVAFDLNSFYLMKRYTDQLATQPDNKYNYYSINADNTLTLHKEEKGLQGTDPGIEVTYTDKNNNSVTRRMSYPEFRLWDGDFVNADCEIHSLLDERYDDGNYYPIYPDDYLFFGQSLTYGFVSGQPHGTYPTALARTEDNRVLLDNESTNRVYRAPGYEGTMDKKVVHFNANCIVPDRYGKEIDRQTSKTTTQHDSTDPITMTGSNVEVTTNTLPNGNIQTVTTTTVDDMASQQRTVTTVTVTSTPTDVYPNLTGLDFTGYGDNTYAQGEDGNGIFYTPILDYRTLMGFANPEQSRNMLVYANSSADAKGYKVLSDYLIEPTLEFEDADYKNIPRVSDAMSSAVQGHLVNKNGSDYVTDCNHFLVDENNFHCPIAFSMGSGKRMWYQRTPCTFADGTNNGASGYESILLPFTAELVSAHQKGEITHFYGNDQKNHEYWLRGFQGVETDGSTLKFIRPMMDKTTDAGYDYRYATTASYTVGNTFLYDNYYSNSSSQDANKDEYQEYYNEARTYTDYIPLTANVPYIMAFPGSKYYEFDMSGSFIPANTFATIGKLDKQNVSFCSAAGATIGVSPTTDDGLASTKGGYIFQGLLQKRDMTTTAETGALILTTTGNTFTDRMNIYLDNATSHELTVMQPFHAYLKPGSGGVKEFTIGEDASYVIDTDAFTGELRVSAEDRTLIIENCDIKEVNVRIVNAAGQLQAIRTLQPEEVIKVPVHVAGIYLVNSEKVQVK